MDKSKLIPKVGLFGDESPSGIHLITLLASFITLFITPYMPVVVASVVWTGFAATFWIAFVPFIKARRTNMTRNRWFNTRDSSGWIAQDAYGLLQFRYENRRHIAYIGILGKVVVVKEDIRSGPFYNSIPKHIFCIENGRVIVPEKAVKELGLPLSYNGEKVRAYLDGGLVYCDPGSEDELNLYMSLIK